MAATMQLASTSSKRSLLQPEMKERAGWKKEPTATAAAAPAATSPPPKPRGEAVAARRATTRCCCRRLVEALEACKRGCRPGVSMPRTSPKAWSFQGAAEGARTQTRTCIVTLPDCLLRTATYLVAGWGYCRDCWQRADAAASKALDEGLNLSTCIGRRGGGTLFDRGTLDYRGLGLDSLISCDRAGRNL